MDFIETIKNLCIFDSPDEGLSKEQSKLRLAAKAFLSGNDERAESLARELYHETNNTEIKNTSCDILFALLLWQDRFEELELFGLPRDDSDALQIAVYNIPNAEILLSDIPYEAKMPCYPMVQPIMTVVINGESIDLLVDTGARPSAITRSVAERCNIVVGESNIDVHNAQGAKASVELATINTFVIGNIIFKNLHCIVVPDGMLDSHVDGKFRINGTIGWEAIRRLHWEIDYKNRVVRVKAPCHEAVERNMCCDFSPMVNAHLGNGEKIVMELDTGANISYFGKRMAGILANTIVSPDKSGGFIHTERNKKNIIPDQFLSINGARISLKNILIDENKNVSTARTFITAGILGSDVADGRVLVIDYTNRHLSIS